MKIVTLKNLVLTGMTALTLLTTTANQANAFVIVERMTSNDPVLHRKLFSGGRALAIWVIPGMIVAGLSPVGGYLFVAVDSKARASTTDRLAQKIKDLGAPEREANDLAGVLVNAQIDDGDGTTQSVLAMDDIRKVAPTFASSPGFNQLLDVLTVR